MTTSNTSPPQPPTRSEVEEKLVGLLEERYSREEVSSWAERWIALPEPGIDDPVVWNALNELSGADMISTDRPYLYEEADFQAWLAELKGTSRQGR